MKIFIMINLLYIVKNTHKTNVVSDNSKLSIAQSQAIFKLISDKVPIPYYDNYRPMNITSFIKQYGIAKRPHNMNSSWERCFAPHIDSWIYK